MTVFDRVAIALGAVVDDAAEGVENIARGLPRPLPERRIEGRAEVIRCRGTVTTGAQCKRRLVSGSAYCYQHRNQAKLDGRPLAFAEAREKAARMTSDLSLQTWTAAVSATLRLAALGPRMSAQSLSTQWISGMRQVARQTVDSLQVQRRWVASAMALVFVAAVPIAYLILADGDLSSLARFAREIIPRNPLAIARNPNALGSTPPNAAGLFTQDETRPPGTDFAGAYVSSVEHLSADSSMFQIMVPAGVEGTYQAVVSHSEGVEYQCLILHQYTDRLHCVGPTLQEASQLNIRIFRIDEFDGSRILVFETNYTTAEIAFLATPSPTFTPTPTQTPTHTQTPIQILVRTAAESDSGSGDDHPQPATPAATVTPQPATLAATVTPQPATPAATGTPQPATPLATKTPQPATPAATETPQLATPAATETPPSDNHRCKSKPGHPRYCTPTPES